MPLGRSVSQALAELTASLWTGSDSVCNIPDSGAWICVNSVIVLTSDSLRRWCRNICGGARASATLFYGQAPQSAAGMQGMFFMRAHTHSLTFREAKSRRPGPPEWDLPGEKTERKNLGAA